jgi:hypothetical protein
MVAVSFVPLGGCGSSSADSDAASKRTLVYKYKIIGKELSTQLGKSSFFFWDDLNTLYLAVDVLQK